MNIHNKELLEQAMREFSQDVGIGQFSFYKFALWLYENEPALAEYIIEDYLRKVGLEAATL